MESRKLMGFDVPGDQRVSISVRDWNALKLAQWRSVVAMGIVERTASEVLNTCVHSEGCPGESVDTEPCLGTCPNRELRMDALVMMNAAKTFTRTNAGRASSEQYFAPSREYFSDVMRELAATQAENEALREKLDAAGIETPEPPEVKILPARRGPALLPKEAT